MAKALSLISTSLAAGMLVLSSCAHIQSPPEKTDAGLGSSSGSGDSHGAASSPKTLTQVLKTGQGDQGKIEVSASSPSTYVQSNGDVVVEGIKLKNTHFDIPITINSRVEFWVDYFRGKGRPFFEKYLERSEFFVPYIVPILKQNGLPEDLVYLAMIESGFNNLARSRARAVGPWQFISATGRRYGLMVNWWVDERRDIRKSTLAAVEYLRDLYNMMGSWELAAASYNAGEAKIARAVQRFGTKDFWEISKHRFLRQETRDYVPKIIAAALISKNREQFGFAEPEVKPGKDEAVAADGELVKVEKSDKPEEKVEVKPGEPTEKVGDLLAALAKSKGDGEGDDLDDDDPDSDQSKSAPPQSASTASTASTELETKGAGASQEGSHFSGGDGRDNEKDKDQESEKNNDKDGTPLAKPVPMPHLSKDGAVGGVELVEFDVKGPADLLKVARAAGLSYQTVKSLNPELLRWCTPPSVSSYRLRLPAAARDKFLANYNDSKFPRQVKFMPYKVKRGETLAHIARRFGIRVDPIADLNGVSARMRLRKGRQIILPFPDDRSRSLASLDVRDPPERRGHRHRGRRHRRRRRSRYYRISYQERLDATHF